MLQMEGRAKTHESNFVRCVFHTAVTDSQDQSGDVSLGDFYECCIFIHWQQQQKKKMLNDRNWFRFMPSLHSSCKALQTTLYDRHSHFFPHQYKYFNCLAYIPAVCVCDLCGLKSPTEIQCFHLRQITQNSS